LVAYEWIRMPDSTGFGDYTESGTVIPVTYNGVPVCKEGRGRSGKEEAGRESRKKYSRACR
jgi:hypothetical protein